ncbi:hypothetical protein CDL15_Pgr028204 [Punica granatum]|uniref:Uncharacterized protein n=1 Tax=Punica granatum TaxID=22663 RepID=A0A218WU11_PUNGR|nr:hypothetical protein CDL15_Pgr028204 [Punica granatum]
MPLYKRKPFSLVETPIQSEPTGLVCQVLQSSDMLPLKDFADTIAMKLQDRLYAGVELYGKKEDGVFPCRIMKTRNLPPSNLVLIIETHSTLLWLLIKDDGEYSSYVQGKRRSLWSYRSSCKIRNSPDAGESCP